MLFNRQLNFALWFSAVHVPPGNERERVRHLPEFNPGWFDALRIARKEWLLERVKEIEALAPDERQAALCELSDVDLMLIGMKRTKLEVRDRGETLH